MIDKSEKELFRKDKVVLVQIVRVIMNFPIRKNKTRKDNVILKL